MIGPLLLPREQVGRAGRPEEIAGTVLWLCSDLAAFTVGSNIVVDGGQTARRRSGDECKEWPD